MISSKYKIGITTEDSLLKYREDIGPTQTTINGILNTKEKAIRKGLIKMGWLPPEVGDLIPRLICSVENQYVIEAGLIAEQINDILKDQQEESM